MYTTSTSVWQRRTNKIIAAAVVIIGLTMMISTIPQCIYAGVIFIVLALGWLGWMRMKEKKAEEEQQSRAIASHPTAPILFIMASQHLPSRPVGPTLPDPNDKPPSYDQVVNLDGLPPDYFSVLSAAKPPRYEDIAAAVSSSIKGWTGGSTSPPPDSSSPNIPGVHTSGIHITSSSSSGSLSGMVPLTLDVPNLLQDIGFLPSTSWSLHPGEDGTPSDIRIEEGTAWVVGVPASFTNGNKTSKELKKSYSGTLSTCSEINEHPADQNP